LWACFFTLHNWLRIAAETIMRFLRGYGCVDWAWLAVLYHLANGSRSILLHAGTSVFLIKHSTSLSSLIRDRPFKLTLVLDLLLVIQLLISDIADMRFSILSTVVFVVESLILSTFAQVTPITDFPDYKTARGCVQSAASWGLYVYGIDDLGCGQQQSQTCLCGAIGSVSAQINDYIYTYASSGCGDTIEASSAAGIFHAYCTTSAVEPAAATSMVSTSIDVENFLTTAGLYFNFLTRYRWR
jgi:hypothetical protein